MTGRDATSLPRKQHHRDWLVFPDSWNRLHRVHAAIEWDADEGITTATTICGRSGPMVMPGVLSRLSLVRCAHCCRKLGIPVGPGNTLNAGIEEPA